MVRKSFRVTVCLDLHQVTCPGVWLCPKGKIFITVCLFKCLETTKQVKPMFPLKFHQRFVFDKIFDSVSSLGELETEMSSRNLRMEMVQVFKGKLKMVTLGVFQAALTSVLYPSVASGSDTGAAEVDLLFEPCQPFPGIISPKAEVSTRAVIEELRLCPKFTEGPVNPTLVPSTMKCSRAKSRQRTVCHNKPSKCTCTCCNCVVSKKRPKTEGSRLSPPARSTRCKGQPPPRPSTIEGGSESGADSESKGHCREVLRGSCESESSQSPDLQYQSQLFKDRGENVGLASNIQLSGEQSGDKDRSRRQRRSTHEEPPRPSHSREDGTSQNKCRSPPILAGFSQQKVHAEVHADASDNDDDSQGSRDNLKATQFQNGSSPSGSQYHINKQSLDIRKRITVESNTKTPKTFDRNSVNPPSGGNEFTVGRARASKDEESSLLSSPRKNKELRTHQEINQGVAGPGCDCFTCSPCRQAMEKLMVPWKIYAAPPSLEHCFCHSRKDADKNHDCCPQSGATKSIPNSYQRRVVASQSATTQTSAICRCQEPSTFSVLNRKSKEKSERNSNWNPPTENTRHLCPCCYLKSNQVECSERQETDDRRKLSAKSTCQMKLSNPRLKDQVQVRVALLPEQDNLRQKRLSRKNKK